MSCINLLNLKLSFTLFISRLIALSIYVLAKHVIYCYFHDSLSFSEMACSCRSVVLDLFMLLDYEEDEKRQLIVCNVMHYTRLHKGSGRETHQPCHAACLTTSVGLLLNTFFHPGISSSFGHKCTFRDGYNASICCPFIPVKIAHVSVIDYHIFVWLTQTCLPKMHMLLICKSKYILREIPAELHFC